MIAAMCSGKRFRSVLAAEILALVTSCVRLAGQRGDDRCADFGPMSWRGNSGDHCRCPLLADERGGDIGALLGRSLLAPQRCNDLRVSLWSGDGLLPARAAATFARASKCIPITLTCRWLYCSRAAPPFPAPRSARYRPRAHR